MINKKIRLLVLVALAVSSVQAQSIRDGIKELYSGRLEEATRILEKNTSSPEGVYWLARTYVKKDHMDSARFVFDKALATNANAPYLLVGKGFFLLEDKKVNEARQAFEQALTNSRGKKNDDPAILNAVGRAIVQAYNSVDKIGDINYAVQKLEQAAAQATAEKKKDNWFIADIYTNLGDAYRKAKPGEGSPAFDAYQSALNADPNFAQAHYRKALIFKSQRNWQLYVDNINKAIAADANFIPGYESLYEYYLLVMKDFNAAQKVADQIITHSPGNPNNEYYAAQTYFVNKKYDQAIASAKKVIATANEHTNPSAYKVIAYSLFDKKDTAAAIPFVEDYFKKQKREEFVPADYTMRAMAYSSTPGREDMVYQSYIDGLKADTVLENRIDMLEEGAKFFGDKGKYEMQGNLLSKLIEIKPADKVTINDYFNAGYFGYYKAGLYEKAWKLFDTIRTKYPAQNYGYQWTYNCSKIFDSTNAKNIMLSDAEKLIAFSKADTALSAQNTIFATAADLATFYANVKNDKENSLKYLQIAYDAATDPAAKQQLKGYIDALSKPSGASKPSAKPTSKPKGGK